MRSTAQSDVVGASRPSGIERRGTRNEIPRVRQGGSFGAWGATEGEGVKILEPIKESDVPRQSGGKGSASKHAGLFERVLELNGEALPIEFNTSEEALMQARTWRNVRGACSGRGIQARQRGNIVFLSKRP